MYWFVSKRSVCRSSYSLRSINLIWIIVFRRELCMRMMREWMGQHELISYLSHSTKFMHFLMLRTFFFAFFLSWRRWVRCAVAIKRASIYRFRFKTLSAFCVWGEQLAVSTAALHIIIFSIHVHRPLLFLFKITIKEANRLMHVLSAVGPKTSIITFVAYLCH